MPSANAVFLPRVLDENLAFYQAKYVYDAGWQLLEVIEHAFPHPPGGLAQPMGCIEVDWGR